MGFSGSVAPAGLLDPSRNVARPTFNRRWLRQCRQQSFVQCGCHSGLRVTAIDAAKPGPQIRTQNESDRTRHGNAPPLTAEIDDK